MPIFLALLGGSIAGTVLGYILGQRKTTQELTGVQQGASVAGPVSEPDAGLGNDPRYPGDPTYAPVTPGSFQSAASTGSAAADVPWMVALTMTPPSAPYVE